MKIAFSSDHAGIAMRLELQGLALELDHEVRDLGPFPGEKCDYPDSAKQVARMIQHKVADLGVLVCGSGIGMSMAANRFLGVRAVVAVLEIQARLARRHNKANVLCLGQRITGMETAKAIFEVFLSTGFDAGRHEDRVAKIDQVAEQC